MKGSPSLQPKPAQHINIETIVSDSGDKKSSEEAKKLEKNQVDTPEKKTTEK
jgi:hypothetical protein